MKPWAAQLFTALATFGRSRQAGVLFIDQALLDRHCAGRRLQHGHLMVNLIEDAHRETVDRL